MAEPDPVDHQLLQNVEAAVLGQGAGAAAVLGQGAGAAAHGHGHDQDDPLDHQLQNVAAHMLQGVVAPVLVEVSGVPHGNAQAVFAGDIGGQWLQELGVPKYDQGLAPKFLNLKGHNRKDEADGFGDTQNLPHGDINWPAHDKWSQDLERAHFDQGFTVEISGNNQAVNNFTVNLPDLVIDEQLPNEWLANLGEAAEQLNEIAEQLPNEWLADLGEAAGQLNEIAEQLPNEWLADLGEAAEQLNEIAGDDGGGNGQHLLDGGEGNVFAIGLEHLRNDARLLPLINEHPQIPAFDEHGMNTFQKLIRALIEEGGSQANRPSRYGRLSAICLNNVNPISVAALGVEQLVGIGVQGQFKAQAIHNFAASFGNDDEVDIDQLVTLTSRNLFRRFYMVNRVGPYCALYMLIFGMERLDFMPADEINLKSRIQRHYPPNGNVAYENWTPYQGLAAWLIWTYVHRH